MFEPVLSRPRLWRLTGWALEIRQSLSGFHNGNIFDMAANTPGVGLGWLTAPALPDWRSRLDRMTAR